MCGCFVLLLEMEYEKLFINLTVEIYCFPCYNKTSEIVDNLYIEGMLKWN